MSFFKKSWRFTKEHGATLALILTLSTAVFGAGLFVSQIQSDITELKEKTNNMQELMEDIDKKINFFMLHTDRTIRDNILKQSQMISSNPDDVKIIDIETAIRDYEFLEDKSGQITLHYEKIVDFYKSCNQ